MDPSESSLRPVKAIGNRHGSSDDLFLNEIKNPVAKKRLIDENHKRDPSEMSYSRRFALWLLRTTKWYDRREQTRDILKKRIADFHKIVSGDDGGEASFITKHDEDIKEEDLPDLRKSWAFYEHMTLPRFVRNNESDSNYLEKARTGESHGDKGTELYPVVGTTPKDLKGFGVSIGLYFMTVLALAIVTFVVGLINTYLIYSYASNDSQFVLTNVLLGLDGSAYCKNIRLVPIENLAPDDMKCDKVKNSTEKRCFMFKNDCENPNFISMGVVHYVSTLLLIIGMYVIFFHYQQKLEVKYDEETLTASDYSVEIKNPPKDAIDPEEWREFFMPFSEKFVNSCTIVINNEELVKALVARRILLKELKNLLPPGIDIESDSWKRNFLQQEPPAWKNFVQGAGFGKDISSLLKNLHCCEMSIRTHAEYERIEEVNHVIITFETENGQRTALEALSCGKLEGYFRTKRRMSIPRFNRQFLKIKEPPEPNDVRWHDLDETTFLRMKQQVISNSSSVMMVLVGCYVAQTIQDPVYSSVFISVFNGGIAVFGAVATSLEAHRNEGAYQRSLFFKIALARVFTTVFLYYSITPFTEFVHAGEEKTSLVERMASLFFSEMIIAPLLIVVDPAGLYAKFVQAPRALTQDSMDSNFLGSNFSLAERYTSLTKVLFMCFFYATILPVSYFFCSFTLLVVYFSDKYALLRIWREVPASGPNVAKFSRDYFFTTALVLHATMAAYWWSGFPYDNVYEKDEKFYFVLQYLLWHTYPARPTDLNEFQPEGIPDDW
eukprot:CAMPEP_0194283838 /NCGR_PEP_ID=MMETSP0169-20130528/26235_1 /TAXON_ID=218684 /ORGANISM="Corethron pennatum, Strain L29A3" /LENGTH=777 /DNA_ID=CAMNT_0039029523 /DNA_START=214 /DNA_END=2544 /DNA_ORIENTATION=+